MYKDNSFYLKIHSEERILLYCLVEQFFILDGVVLIGMGLNYDPCIVKYLE